MTILNRLCVALRKRPSQLCILLSRLPVPCVRLHDGQLLCGPQGAPELNAEQACDVLAAYQEMARVVWADPDAGFAVMLAEAMAKGEQTSIPAAHALCHATQCTPLLHLRSVI